MYIPFADKCNADPGCKSGGWSILELAVLAEVGHPQQAIDKALGLPAKVFTTPGGNGHSLTNTLWYISTRPKVEALVIPPPLPLPLPLPSPKKNETTSKKNETAMPTMAPPCGKSCEPVSYRHFVTNCGQPKSCTSDVLDKVVGGFTCRSRIDWLMNYKGNTETEACATVGRLEFQQQCGGCAPPTSNTTFDCGLPRQCTPQVLSTQASGVTCLARMQWLTDTQGMTESQACYSVGALEFPSQCGACAPKKAPPTPVRGAESNLPGVVSCGRTSCTGAVLNTLADGYTCLARMAWLMTVQGQSEKSACSIVAGKEYPSECGACNPF